MSDATGALPGHFHGTSGAEKMEMSVIQQWFADKGDQTLRLDYPLTRESIVLDVGGYEGNWAIQINQGFCCTIHIFEPVPQFAEKIRKRFSPPNLHPNIHIHAFGISDQSGNATISINNDSTSVHRSKGLPCKIQLLSAQEAFSALGLEKTGVDLMKINIEGCEYELVQNLIDTGLIEKVRDIQVQFHDFVPDAAARMAKLHELLSKTHELTWQYRFVWENWRRRP